MSARSDEGTRSEEGGGGGEGEPFGEQNVAGIDVVVHNVEAVKEANSSGNVLHGLELPLKEEDLLAGRDLLHELAERLIAELEGEEDLLGIFFLQRVRRNQGEDGDEDGDGGLGWGWVWGEG